MLPRRSSSSGHSQRRSSILKPPKSRQPFQDLDFNASLLENSLDTTKKRRVSFAEKKHVKEFCDHKEQGTIWDSTYEEPDHTNSKSGELTNENEEDIETKIEYGKNLDIMMKQVGYELLDRNQDPRGPEAFLSMHQTGVDQSATKIFFNASTEIEMTNVIASGRDTGNDFASKTILSGDVELDTTETVGGIEPTVSINRIRASRPFVVKDLRDMDETMVFDSSDGDMKFTQVISSQKISQNQNLDKTDSRIEDQTIIFDDVIMDLTPVRYQPESVFGRGRNMTPKGPRACGNITDKENVGVCKKYANRTLLFNDSSCDITEAVNTISQTPGIQLLKGNITENSEDEVNSVYHTSKSGDKTICFNDVDCEMTEAISTLKTRISNAEQSDPLQLVEMSREMEIIEPSEPHSIPLVCKPGTESPEEFLTNNRTKLFNESGMEFTTAITRTKAGEPSEPHSIPLVCKPGTESPEEFLTNNRTKFLNESGMEFTTAITRTKAEENETAENFTIKEDKTVILDDCDIDVTLPVEEAPCRLSPEPESEEQTAPISTGGTSVQFENMESQSEENKIKYENTFIISRDKSSDLSVDENPALSTVDPCSTSDSEEQIYISNENETQNSKKRKSIEIMDADNNKTCNSLISVNSEHNLVQCMVQDEFCVATSDNLSNTFAPNCKRLKVVDSISEEKGSSSVESVLQGNILSKTIDISLLDAEDMPQVQSKVSEDLETASNCVGLEEEPPVSIEEVPEIPVSNYCKDQGSLGIVDNRKSETEAEESLKRIEDVSEEGCSVLEDAPILHLNSDSDSETVELLHVSEKLQLSTVQNNEAESPSEPSRFLDHNDDCCFIMFCEELEKQSKSDNCIWEIRSVDTEKIEIDFISKSLVVVIHLEAAEELTTPRIIKDIRIISLLGDSANEDFAMIHNILLTKLDPDKLKRQHRTTQDVLLLLELISQRVKLMIDFMLEFDKLQDLHLINRTENRISFRLHSYKVQLVIKITINLEPLEEICPNDVTVECVLGSIREKDIKQLITSVKKDHKFLTNYIKDIKEYVAVVVEK